MKNATVQRKEMLDRRITGVRDTLQGAANQLVLRGAIGVAVRLHFPVSSPARALVVAAGHRDREKKVPLDGSELFSIASQSKMFTAAAVMLLVKEGRIALTDPVGRHVADVPAVDADATIEQFLNHTSGIGNFIHAITTLPHPWPTLSYEDIMAMARLHGRQFAAGARLEYNNTDVVVLARLCERLTNLPFNQLVRERILEPLGMSDTFAAVPQADIPRARMASGYYLPGQGYAGPPIDVSAQTDYSIASAAGNMISSLENMCRWMESLVSASGIGLGIGDLVASVADVGGAGGHWFFPRTYGRGVESWCWGGRTVWGHRGSFFGYHSGTFLEPKSGLIFSMAMTMCTEGSFMRFIDIQGHDYMAFMETCCLAGVDALELA